MIPPTHKSLYNNPSSQDTMKFPQNPIPERAPCCFRFITKQLLNHAPWWKTNTKLFRGLLIPLAAASSATASGSSVASASASLRDRSYAQSAQVFVIHHHSPKLLPTFATLDSQPTQAQPIMTKCEAPPSSWVYVCITNFSLQEQPRHISSAAACSSAGASASATSSEAGSWRWS